MKRWILVICFLWVVLLVSCDSGIFTFMDDANQNSGSNNDDEPLGENEAAYITITLTAQDTTTLPHTIRKTFSSGLQGDLSEYVGLGVVAAGVPLMYHVTSATNSINSYMIEASVEPYQPDYSDLNEFLSLSLPSPTLGMHEATITTDDFGSQGRLTQKNYLATYFQMDAYAVQFQWPNLAAFATQQEIEYDFTVSALQIGRQTISGTISTEDVFIRRAEIAAEESEILGPYDLEVEFKLRKFLDVPAYVVTYDGNGASGTGPVYSVKMMNSGEIAYNGGDYVSDPFVNTGKVFTGWNTNTNGTGRFFLPGEVYADDADLVLYATWEDPYPIEETSQGYIFFENQNYETDGWRYLEISETPLPNRFSFWSNVEDSLVGTSSAIGAGDANSLAIIQQEGHTDSAAKQCLEFGEGNHGWYLPSSGELAQAGYHIEAWDNDYSLDTVWSSTEENSSLAYQYRSGTILQGRNKVNSEANPFEYEVYPVRKLNSDKIPILVNE